MPSFRGSSQPGFNKSAQNGKKRKALPGLRVKLPLNMAGMDGWASEKCSQCLDFSFGFGWWVCRCLYDLNNKGLTVCITNTQCGPRKGAYHETRVMIPDSLHLVSV